MALLLDAPLQSQPQEYFELDWGNPLTASLVAAGASGVDAVLASSILPTAGAGTQTTSAGVAMTATTAGDVWTVSNAVTLAADSPLTVFVLAVSNVSDVTRKRVVRLFGVNGALAGIDFGNGASSLIEAYAQIPSAVFNQVQATTANTAGVVQPVAFVKVGTAASIYVDGALSASTTFTDPQLRGPVTGLHLASNSATFPMNGGVVCYAVWGRALSADEVRSVSANPWQLFRVPTWNWMPNDTIYTLTPDSTLANTNWTAVNAATLHGALAAGDGDWMQTGTTGAQADVTLSDPAGALTLSNASVRVRVRLQ